jgi:hypothetical protein
MTEDYDDEFDFDDRDGGGDDDQEIINEEDQEEQEELAKLEAKEKDGHEKKEKRKLPPAEASMQLAQVEGTVLPLARDEKGIPTALAIKVDSKQRYLVVMNDMGVQLRRFCFQEILVKGHIKKDEKGNLTIDVRNYI